MSIGLILEHGIVASVGLTFALLIIGLKNPRLMLQDYPLSIRQSVSPKTATEKRQTIWYGLPFLLIMFGYPLIVGAHFALRNDWQFWQILTFTWGMTLFFNVYDLLILDWLLFCFITPKMVVIPGTEGNEGYKDYWFHFVGFLKGIGITLVMSFVQSGIIEFILSLT